MNRFHRWYCRSTFWSEVLKRTIIPWALEEVRLGDELLEVGPGPGLTTDILRQEYPRVTAIEIDPQLADALRQRLGGTNVTVIEGDAAAMPFEDQTFSGVVSFTMLHHVPSPQLQDRLLEEVFRVLKPGGVFAGIDSRWSLVFALIHLGDTMIMVDPKTLSARLARVGFVDVSVDIVAGRFRFRGRRPLS